MIFTRFHAFCRIRKLEGHGMDGLRCPCLSMYVISHFLVIFRWFFVIFRDFRWFSRVFTRFDAFGSLRDTEGMAWGAPLLRCMLHCYFAFSIHFSLIFCDFRWFSRVFDANGDGSTHPRSFSTCFDANGDDSTHPRSFSTCFNVNGGRVEFTPFATRTGWAQPHTLLFTLLSIRRGSYPSPY